MSFEAKFPSECVGCDEGVKAGEVIAFATGGGVVHLVCPNPLPDVSRPVCPRCFQEQSVNGSCGCD